MVAISAASWISQQLLLQRHSKAARVGSVYIVGGWRTVSLKRFISCMRLQRTPGKETPAVVQTRLLLTRPSADLANPKNCSKSTRPLSVVRGWGLGLRLVSVAHTCHVTLSSDFFGIVWTVMYLSCDLSCDLCGLSCGQRRCDMPEF